MVSTHVLGGVALVAFLLSFWKLPVFVSIAAGAYFVFRFFHLAIHNFVCPTCWTKLLLAGIIFISLAFSFSVRSLPFQILLGLGLIAALVAIPLLMKKKPHKH